MTDTEEALNLGATEVEIQTRSNYYCSLSPSNHQNYAPFLAKAHRFTTNKQQQRHPPVGAYNVPSCFDKKRSLLEERAFKFLMEAEKKKEQMTVFKSSLSRFDKVVKDAPGPASYNLFQTKQNKRQERSLKKHQKEKTNTQIGKSCPSIPNKDNKYGYAMCNGTLRNIQKNKLLLQEERQSRNQYLSTLQGERHFRENTSQTFLSDQRKKLYDQTQKVLLNGSMITNQVEKQSLVQKKPRYQHLYHSKGLSTSDNKADLGPGSYDIKNGAFTSNDKKQKYQFFGSTEVRFKDRTNEMEKGYSLIEMIKENKKYLIKERKSPMLSRAYPIPEKGKTPEQHLPGPGEYDPKDEHLKKSRGVALFPQSERFQGMYPKPEERQSENEPLEEKSQKEKKGPCGKLKKQHFKTIQTVYRPLNSSQIGGIVSKQSEVGRENKGEDPEIKSWSRQEDRNKPGQYMKELKEQLALISQTPRNEATKNQQYNKKTTHHKDP